MLKLNKELKKSIKSNVLTINISNDEYKKMQKIITREKIKYDKEMAKIRNKPYSFQKIVEQNHLVKDIISSVLGEYPILKKYNVCVFLTGSFARYTNKLNSDLDFHMSYDKKYQKELFKYEEVIFYILGSIFDLNRARVHDMLISKLSKTNIKILKRKLDNRSLKIIIKCDTNSVEYECSSMIKSRIYLQHGNKKNLKTISKYLKKEIKKLNREWAHVFFCFTLKDIFQQEYNKLLKYEKRKIRNNKLNKKRKYLIYLVLKQKEKLDYMNANSMQDFKSFYQIQEFSLLYNYLGYRRELVNVKNLKMDNINLYEYNNYFKKDEIYNEILNYIYALFEVVEPLKNSYSIHAENYIDEKIYISLKDKIHKLNNMIMEELLWKEK